MKRAVVVFGVLREGSKGGHCLIGSLFSVLSRRSQFAKPIPQPWRTREGAPFLFYWDGPHFSRQKFAEFLARGPLALNLKRKRGIIYDTANP